MEFLLGYIGFRGIVLEENKELEESLGFRACKLFETATLVFRAALQHVRYQEP